MKKKTISIIFLRSEVSSVESLDVVAASSAADHPMAMIVGGASKQTRGVS